MFGCSEIVSEQIKEKQYNLYLYYYIENIEEINMKQILPKDFSNP